MWLPLQLNDGTGANTVSGLVTFARLASGATLAGASAETATIAKGLMTQFPQRNRNVTPWLVTLQEETIGDITPTLTLLAASVTLLSLIVCAFQDPSRWAAWSGVSSTAASAPNR